jgi:hypothetical protein
LIRAVGCMRGAHTASRSQMLAPVGRRAPGAGSGTGNTRLRRRQAREATARTHRGGGRVL